MTVITEHQHHEFPTPEPVSLFVELGAGTVAVRASETTTTVVTVEGRDADEVRVDRAGRQLSVIGPRQRILGFGTGGRLTVTIEVPTGSQVAARTGSADLDLAGELGTVQLRAGSGTIRVEAVTGPTVLETGSGAVHLGTAGADLRIKSGSGAVTVDSTAREVVVSTGSGSVAIGTAEGPVRVKTGSGDLRVGDAAADVSLATGSGDLEIGSARRGRITGKGASGDIRIAIPAGVPVWTDVATVSGRIRSSLTGAGQPAPGQDHVEVRARTASGDITLVEL